MAFGAARVVREEEEGGEDTSAWRHVRKGARGGAGGEWLISQHTRGHANLNANGMCGWRRRELKRQWHVWVAATATWGWRR